MIRYDLASRMVKTCEDSSSNPEKLKSLKQQLIEANSIQEQEHNDGDDTIFSIMDDAKEKLTDEDKKVFAAFSKLLDANKLIYSTLFQCLHEDVHKYLIGVKTGDGIGAWLALLAEFQRSSRTAKRALMAELFRIRQVKGEPVSDYLFRIHAISRDLKALNSETDTERSHLTCSCVL